MNEQLLNKQMNETSDSALDVKNTKMVWCEDCHRSGVLCVVEAEWNPTSKQANSHKWVCAKGCIVQCVHCMSLLQLRESMRYDDTECCVCNKVFRTPPFKWYGISASENDQRLGFYRSHDTRPFRLLEPFSSLREDLKCEIKLLLLITNRFGIKLPKEVLTIICEDLFMAERRQFGSLQGCLTTMMDYNIEFRRKFRYDPDMEFSIRVTCDFDDEQHREAEIYVQVEEHDRDHIFCQTATATFICNYHGEILGDWPTISDRYGDGFDFTLKDLAVEFFVDDYHRYIRQKQVLKEILMMLTRTCVSRDVRILIGEFMRDNLRREFLGYR